MSTYLSSAIEYLKGVGPQKGEAIRKEFDITTFYDLLKYFPFRHEDRSVIHSIEDITDRTQFIQLKGNISHFSELGERQSHRLIANFEDETGEIELVWFRGIDFIRKKLKTNIPYIVYGKPVWFNQSYNISHPEIDLATELALSNTKGLQPVYSTTEKAKRKFLDSKAIQKLVRQLLDNLKEKDLGEYIPAYIIEKERLLSRYEAYINIHFPKSENYLQDAVHRIKFEELFLVQMRVMRLKFNHNNTVKGFFLEKIDRYFAVFYKEKMPFELTNAQKKVLKEIRKDTLSGLQMNRLLQGDVGSGKTIVALITLLMALDNNFQGCLMAPTEILAQQHFESISTLLKGMGVEVSLLTGSVKGKTRKYILENLKEGSIQLIIGTHALLEKPVEFKNLGLVIIDEQHRFGVAQRAKLWAKSPAGFLPHILVMTATPIPRTLAMTVYGDLDVSIIDELPPGRKPIKTVHRTDADRLRLFGFIQEQIAEGRQIYFVYPMIEESEMLDLKNLMEGFESISRAFPLPNYKISILHGKMKPADKDFEMQRFVKGETQIMVATTVIEVGVNVPNASVMIIENAERFGLSQLHQLRGRVGRGASQSFCILMTNPKLSQDSKKRVQVMCKTNDGFIIAEEDLKLRGPGDLDGTKQSGAMNLKLANLAEDGHIIEAARSAALHIISTDPYLENPLHFSLKKYLIEQSKQNIWGQIS